LDRPCKVLHGGLQIFYAAGLDRRSARQNMKPGTA
jgi:hypothetical protein